MSWIGTLYDTYQYCQPLVGKAEAEDSPILMPIAHTTQNAHIELSIDMDGSFLLGTARVIESKSDSVTIIPCTEKSQSRSGSCPINHPLFDKLQYLAGDYTSFGGDKGDGFHADYMTDLRKWCASPYANARVCAILKYLEKNTLVADLIKEELLPLDEDGHIIRKWDSKKHGEKRGVYKAGSVLNDALDAFIRIDVVSEEKAQIALWNDQQLWEDFISYYAHGESRDDICYVRGERVPCSDMSPAKIRGTGDKAKLISSNDSSGFTYRGRFTDAQQVAQIGYETTQKAHNALKWLIAKQGFRNGEQVFVTWGTKNEPPVAIENDTPSLMAAFFGSDDDMPYVHTEYAHKLNSLMGGYYQKIGERAGMVTMGLDAATPGRMSIIYYEELSREEYLKQLQNWYSSCAWRLDYIMKDDNGHPVGVYGTPSPKDILFAVYGSSASDKLKKSAMQRLMPCILEGKKLPSDFAISAARRAGNPMAMENWEYRKTLCIACALIRKYYMEKDKGVTYEMALELDNLERSYLFGRALAYYHYIEYSAMRPDERRPTNALRYKSTYVHRPAKTMALLDEKLGPYVKKLYSGFNNVAMLSPEKQEQSQKKSGYMAKVLRGKQEVIDKIKSSDMTNEPLNPTYLLGYSSQLVELYNSKGE